VSVAIVRPATVDGEVDAPPSKSYTHRFLLAAHLSGRTGRLRGPLVSDDTLRTAYALAQLGSDVRAGTRVWRITPRPTAPTRGTLTIDCGESGTTLRFLAAAAALHGGRFRFVGRGRLPQRPMGPLFGALRDLGASISREAGLSTLPFTLRGPIHGGLVELAVDESSQFTSALLFALPTVRPSSRIRTFGPPVSEPYVRASLAVIRGQGVRAVAGPSGYRLPGGQCYRAVDASAPGDASSAAYLWALAAITGGRATVRGLDPRWPQADLAVLPLLRRYGATVTRRGGTVSVRGGERRPFRIELTDSPDLYPLAGVLGASAPGRSYLLGAEHVVAKESDRRQETVRLVRSLGARATEFDGGLAVEGTRRVRPLHLRSARDHRIVMSAAVAAAAASGPSEIGDASAVGKSFPGFFEAIARLGTEVVFR
jgi:3-phosphoshikimate 1-carboxyvinyltransferase